MLTISFKPSFLRKMSGLDAALREEAVEKIELLKDLENHCILRVHKLHGPLGSRYSFSVNYKTRIVFEYISKTEVALLAIGDHDIYN